MSDSKELSKAALDHEGASLNVRVQPKPAADPVDQGQLPTLIGGVWKKGAGTDMI